MTAVATPAGAVSRHTVAWHAMNWQKAQTIVRRLQARSVQATPRGRWGKVHALQRLLTHAFAAKVLAVKRVTENPGKRTAGVEKILWDTPEPKAMAVAPLRPHGYRALPLRRVSIPKQGGTGQRPLSIPCMQDRAMQALYLHALDPIAATLAEPNPYGFRLERSPADAIEQGPRVLSLRWSAPWLLAGDSRSCFDRISHDWLLAHIPMEKAILRQWLTAGFMDKHVLSPTATGVPQGGIASPVLMNLTLHGLERHIRGAFPRFPGSQRTKVHVIRLADDFIIPGRTRAFLEQEVYPLVEPCLAARGLELAHAKTRITHSEDGFDCLGTHLRKSHGKLLGTPAKKNVHALLETIRHLVQHQKQAPAGHLMLQLNPVMRGWAQYHQHGASKRTFATVEHHIFTLLWQWAQRRHPHKARWWIKEQDFRSEHGNNWVFFGHVMRPSGRVQAVRLFRASRGPMRRHTKIQGEANPYAPQWEPYLEARAGVRMARNLQGRRQLLRLWKAQAGLCAVCQQRITELTGWHSHPIVWRTHGGTDRADNRVLLHPNGHAQVHNQRLEVVKPRPQQGVRKA